MIAPSGAAKEKMSRRLRICGGVRERDRSVVVRPSAVGPDNGQLKWVSILTLMHEHREKDDQA